MNDLNVWTGIGRATRDAELRYTKGGTAILSFGIAVGRSIPPQGEGGEWKHETSFFEVEAWARLAESAAKWIRKGKQLSIKAELRQDRWEDATSNTSRSKVYLVAESLQALADPRPKDATSPSPVQPPEPRPPAPPAAADDDFPDDIPF